jgi:hypothetical protein
MLWLNSDDLLGPGSLFMVALAYLTDKADIMAGFCCEHTRNRFGVVNLPAATQATFNIECLSDIFAYWLKGHYFYQPEVAFSRRILELAGRGLVQELHYTMDYEFWLRCARAGARLAVVHWPIGLFRKHEKQKTDQLAETIIEQAKVRDRFLVPQPGFERKLQINQRLRRTFSKAVPEIAVVSTRASKIFSPDTARELRELLAKEGVRAAFHDGFEDLRLRPDSLVIALMHLHKEQPALEKLRQGGHDGPIAGWCWDNHQYVFENYTAVENLDVCIPGHAFAGNYLRSRRYFTIAPLPLCVTQWTAREARDFFKRHAHGGRSNDLYGGFVRYASAQKRNRLIEQLIADGKEGVYFLEEDALGRYFGLPLEERFQQWASHKVSLCLPLAGDLSQRLFDALLTGQIPLVPSDVHDLDQVIPPELQAELPIVRFSDYTAAAVEAVQAMALHLFDRDGKAGEIRRHRFALENHMFVLRIQRIISDLRQLAAAQ